MYNIEQKAMLISFVSFRFRFQPGFNVTSDDPERSNDSYIESSRFKSKKVETDWLRILRIVNTRETCLFELSSSATNSI